MLYTKFNGCEITKKNLQKNEKNHFESLHIVYDPVIDDIPIQRFLLTSCRQKLRW